MNYAGHLKWTAALCAVLLLIVFTGTTSRAAISSSVSVEELVENRPFFGDYDAMVERRFIRVLVPYSKTFFFFDGAEPKGLTYEAVMGFGKYINKKLNSKHIEVKVFLAPTPREELLTKLELGLGDIAVGNLTITDDRREKVDFSEPGLTGVSEIFVTSRDRDGEPLQSPFDLAGRTVHVRKSSSYYQSLLNLNDVLASTGKKLIDIVEADDHLEDEDLLEMVNANLIAGIIIDKHKGEFWEKILPNLQLHPKAAVASGGNIGWAIRKNCPELKREVDEYIAKHKKGTLLGNVVFNRYLKNTKYITDSAHGQNIKRFNNVVEYFRKYGKKYDFDYLMLTALAYQESKLNQNLRSNAGAVGVMQILPSTAQDKNINIPDIDKLEPNIHAGTKYLRFVADRYFPRDGELDVLNRGLFCFASYNAGPAKVARLRAEAEKSGLNPNVWFNNVERIAAKRVGRETVHYVSNIFKYYIAYKLLEEQVTSE